MKALNIGPIPAGAGLLKPIEELKPDPANPRLHEKEADPAGREQR
jgi:hypothetical protein